MDEQTYEEDRLGWSTAYPDLTKPGAIPLRMVGQNVYPAEVTASFGPAAAPGTGAGIDPGAASCDIGNTSTAGCVITAPLPPDCDSAFRCVVVFEAKIDECDPTKFLCPRFVGVFCMDTARPGLSFGEWFVMEDPSWLTGDPTPVAWYLVQMPAMPGSTRLCSPQNTNAAGGYQSEVPPNAPVGNYAPCTLQDLVRLRELCALADADGNVTIAGVSFTLPADFCTNVTNVINLVEDPGANLPDPNNPPGGPLHMPVQVGVCISEWTVTFNTGGGSSHGENGEPCPGSWDPPALSNIRCMSTLAWGYFKAMGGDPPNGSPNCSPGSMGGPAPPSSPAGPGQCTDTVSTPNGKGGYTITYVTRPCRNTAECQNLTPAQREILAELFAKGLASPLSDPCVNYAMVQVYMQHDGENCGSANAPGGSNGEPTAPTPPNDCSRTFHVNHGACSPVGATCRGAAHNVELPGVWVVPNENGDGGYHRGNQGDPGAEQGGYDPCDPANRVAVPPCAGTGGMHVDDPAGGTGGATSNQPSNGGGPSTTFNPDPAVVIPLNHQTTSTKPKDCPQSPCNYYCVTCKTAMAAGRNTPNAPGGSWLATKLYHACEPNLSNNDALARMQCGAAGPCTQSTADSARTSNCDPTEGCPDPEPNFPADLPTEDFYSKCPVCQCYIEGSYKCQGTPAAFTQGDWQLKCECKPLSEWKQHFSEIRCGQYRQAVANGSAFGVFTPKGCGTSQTDGNGKKTTDECSAKGINYTGAASGNNTTPININYTSHTTPCDGAQIVSYNVDNNGNIISGTGSGGGGTCRGTDGATGFTSDPHAFATSTCKPPSGQTVNCAAGPSYGTAVDVTFNQVCQPYKQARASYCVAMRSGDTCPSWNDFRLQNFGDCEKCKFSAMVGSTRGSGLCTDQRTHRLYSCCCTTSITYVPDASACPKKFIGVKCPGVNTPSGSTINLCGCATITVAGLIKTSYQRNDCKPNPTIP